MKLMTTERPAGFPDHHGTVCFMSSGHCNPPSPGISPFLEEFPSTGFGGQKTPSETLQPETEGSSSLMTRKSVRGEGLRQEVE